MKSKAFSVVAILGTLAVVFIGCVVQQRPADSTPATATPAATPAPAATDTAAATATATTTAAPTATTTAAPATTTTAAPAGKVMNKPKATTAPVGDGGA